MFTLSSEYALRAMIYLTRQADGQPVSGQCVAEQAGIPRKYLSKILGDLVRAGVLDGSRGRHGGFKLSRAPQTIHLQEVLAPFEPTLTNRRPCPFGNVACSDEFPCAGHDRWKTVREAYRGFLCETTIYDVAVSRDNGKDGAAINESNGKRKRR